MKDVEMVAQLLLFLEEGAKTYSADYLDKAFSERDSEWEQKDEIEAEFRKTIENIKKILELSKDINLPKTRLKNQADFYSLFGAVAELNREDKVIIDEETGSKINDFLKVVEDRELQNRSKETLLNFCDNKGYAFTSRIKRVESLAEKIETGRFKKWSDLDDLFACTVIIPTLLHEKEVIEFCKSAFEIIRTVKRGQNKKSPDTFRFDSTRYAYSCF
jgi:hypothetical protein